MTKRAADYYVLAEDWRTPVGVRSLRTWRKWYYSAPVGKLTVAITTVVLGSERWSRKARLSALSLGAQGVIIWTHFGDQDESPIAGLASGDAVLLWETEVRRYGVEFPMSRMRWRLDADLNCYLNGYASRDEAALAHRNVVSRYRRALKKLERGQAV